MTEPAFDAVAARRLWAASWIGGGLMAWLLIWPVPYLPLMLAAALSPFVALVMVLLGRSRITLETWHQLTGDKGGRVSVLALWLLPAGALGFRALSDYRVVDPAPVGFVATGLAVVFAIAAAVVDRRTRDKLAPVNILVGLLWGWGVAVLANVELDRTPGRLRPAVVDDRYDRSRGPPTLVVSLADGSIDKVKFEVDWRTYEDTPVGAPVCIADNPGLFGWRSLSLAGCEGPLLQLGQDPPADDRGEVR